MDTDIYKMDKTAFSYDEFGVEGNEKAYWLSKTPQERIQALEYMRQVIYGYDPATERLQRVYSIVESEVR
jgi:hypothetical protein